MRGGVLLAVGGFFVMLYGGFVHHWTFGGIDPSAVQLTQVYADSLRITIGGMGLFMMGWFGVMSEYLKRIEEAIKEKPEE